MIILIGLACAALFAWIVISGRAWCDKAEKQFASEEARKVVKRTEEQLSFPYAD